MDDGQKKIWICLFAVVLAAVVIGILYSFSSSGEHSSEGFLIQAPCVQCAGVREQGNNAQGEVSGHAV